MLIHHQGYDSSTKEKKHRIGILTGNIKKEQLYETSTFFLFQASTKTTPDPHGDTVIWNQVPPLFDYKQQKVKHTH